MAREIDWMDAEEIGILLQAKSNEGILEAIQTAWNEEWEDAK